MYVVQTKYQIVGLTPDLMHLIDPKGEAVVTAEREDDMWTIKGDGVEDAHVPHDRERAFEVMADQCVAVTGESGCAVFVPDALRALP